MKRWPLVGLVLAVLWLFVRGVPVDVETIAEELLFGLALGLPLAFVIRRFYKETIRGLRVLRAIPAMVVYVVLFLWELLTANVDVAYRVLSPSMPIEPRVIEIPLRVRTDLGITTIANSITLTPGTLTMDYDDDRNTLYVHAIAGEDRDAVIAPIRRWEDYALRIFDEEAEPGDPVPVIDDAGEEHTVEPAGSPKQDDESLDHGDDGNAGVSEPGPADEGGEADGD